MLELVDYLNAAVDAGASDMFIVTGSPVCVKLKKQVSPIGADRETILKPQDVHRLVEDLYQKADRPMELFLHKGDDDFSISLPGRARLRVNTYRTRGSLAAVVRIVPFGIPDYRKMGIPENVMRLADQTDGMVLVTGTAGSGKSTTLACIIDRINQNYQRHIVTMENPIEYVHNNRKSIVSQREIAIDTEDYLSALRASLRQAPDVILLGEMRDNETIHTALTAAETGHLLFATLHTMNAAESISRIVDAFPSVQQMQVRVQLSVVLKTVVSQQLLPGVNDELVPAFEILHVTPAIRNLIREGGSADQFTSYMNMNSKDTGMITMQKSIEKLLEDGKITEETAEKFQKDESVGKSRGREEAPARPRREETRRKFF